MAQLSGVAAAVKNQGYILVLGQVAHHLVELAVRYADGIWDVPFVVLGTFGPGIDDR